MKTAPEIIALHLSWDIEEVRGQQYQSDRYSSPIYTCNHGWTFGTQGQTDRLLEHFWTNSVSEGWCGEDVFHENKKVEW